MNATGAHETCAVKLPELWTGWWTGFCESDVGLILPHRSIARSRYVGSFTPAACQYWLSSFFSNPLIPEAVAVNVPVSGTVSVPFHSILAPS